jgi:hypothetical protein
VAADDVVVRKVFRRLIWFLFLLVVSRPHRRCRRGGRAGCGWIFSPGGFAAGLSFVAIMLIVSAVLTARVAARAAKC